MMEWFSILRARLRALFRRESVLQDIEEELRVHIEMETETNIKRGTAPDEARAAALKSFGNLVRNTERGYDIRGGGWLETTWHDLRYGARILLRTPGFTLVAVSTLALGIGANTAIFSLVEAVLLRPLPFPEPERLVMIWEAGSGKRSLRGNPAPGNYSDWRMQNRVFGDVAAFSSLSLNLTGDGNPEKINAQAVTANFFSVLGSKPALGRTFIPMDDRPEAGKVVLLSYGLWQRRFGSNPNLVGKDILLNDQKFTVVGVMPAGFQLLGAEIGIWVPAAFSQRDLTDRGSHYLTVIARLKAGVTIEQAQAEIETITQRIAQDFPKDAANLSAFVLPLHEHLAGGMRLALTVLLAAVGCVLLIACANIANLLLARAAARHKEMAVRNALGASRLRIVRQLLTESMLLASLGGATGLLFAFWSFAFLKQLIPETMALSSKLSISAPVFGYTLLLSLLTGLGFGIAPALQATKLDLNEALKQGGGRTGLGASYRRLRGALAVAEVSLALVLLVGAGLLIQTFVRLRNLDPGFRPEDVLTVTTSLSRNKYGELPKRDAFYQQVLERVRALPGVVSASYTTAVPLTMKGGANGFSIERRDQKPGQIANQRQISSDYFQTLSIPLHRGRYFDEHDGPESPLVAIINETMARQFWPDEDALDKRFKLGPYDSARPWVTIVGVVGDAKQRLDTPVRAEMYFPYQQASDFWATPGNLAVRTAGDPLSFATAVRHAVWAVDRDQPISNIKTMEEILAGEVSQRRLGMSLLTAFAALALLLASLGIYGVLSYAVTQRMPEIGMRMALGARPGGVLRMILGEGLRLVLLGLGIGLAASFALTRVMANLLFGVRATDPLTFAAVSLLLILVSLIACYMPAQRATKIDPLVALRTE